MKAYSTALASIILSSISAVSYAGDSDYADNHSRALDELTACSQRGGDCSNEANRVQETSKRFYQGMGDRMKAQEENRRRIQQEEMWREQVRKKY